MPQALPTIVFVGGGHAHLGVLADWIWRGSPEARTIMLSPQRQTRYSGMIPGTLAGEYGREEGLIDVAALAGRAGAEFVEDRCVAIDPAGRTLATASGQRIAFDYCSIDTGGVGQATGTIGEDPRIVDVRPIGTFLARIDERIAGVAHRPRHLAVVGGGAGGVELAFALRRRFGSAPRITLVTGADGALPGFGNRARALLERELARHAIGALAEDARVEAGTFYAGGQSLEPLDIVITSLGAAAPEWPAQGGLAVDPDGFIAVDRHQRSLSHPHVLAAGDVAARQDMPVARSGVHAVHSGKALAANLRHLATGRGRLRSYRPRPASLYLLSTGPRTAIAIYGPIALRGRWPGTLKRWIDRRWVESFAKLAQSV